MRIASTTDLNSATQDSSSFPVAPLPKRSLSLAPTCAETFTSAAFGHIRKISDSLNSPTAVLLYLTAFELMEEIRCGGLFDRPVRYSVRATKSVDSFIENNTRLFECEVALSCCGISPDPASQFFNISLVPPGSTPQPFLRAALSDSMTSFCFQEKTLRVSECYSGESADVGYIVAKSMHCGYRWEIFTPTKLLRYTVSNESCAPACCHCPCGRCAVLSLDVRDESTGCSVAKMTKAWRSCFVGVTEYSNYQVTLPNGADWRDKALLLALSIWMHNESFINCACV